MHYYIFAATAALLIIWTIGSYWFIKNLEEPTYKVLEKKDGYEIRQYEPYIVAQTEVSGAYREALEAGFRIIADYIFGNNTSRASIAMTTPVLEASSEKIAMTVPVLEAAATDNQRVVSFVLPSQYTMETLPTPNDERVKLVAVPARKVAALRFTGYATATRIEKKKVELASLLATDTLRPIANMQVAQYNPPLSMPLTRRNEILVEVE